jgi:RimJ/RimL family protein N-acetyltransferase
MSADAEVMGYFPARLDRAQAEALVRQITRDLEHCGFGWWAVEVPGRFTFAGFAGLFMPRFHAHFTPCVEIGWRLRREAWGKGYATEAGQACLAFGFDRLGLDEIVSMAVAGNQRSRRVMERLGMNRRPADDFGHPRIAFGHPLRHQVLYRLARAEWTARRSGSSPQQD